MKIIKLLSVVSTLFLMLSLFTGCGKKEYSGYKVQEPSEFKAWQKEYKEIKDIKAPKQATVVFMGVEYSGEYNKSYELPPITFRIHEYEGEDANFSCSAETGELVSFIPKVKTGGIFGITDEERHEKADLIASEFIKLSDYEVEISENNGTYGYEYYREIDGYKTSDALTVYIRLLGELSAVHLEMIGSMENVTETPKLNMDDLERIAAEKIKEIYKDKKRETRIDEAILTILPDGQIGYYCKVSAVKRTVDKNDKNISYVISDPYKFLIG